MKWTLSSWQCGLGHMVSVTWWTWSWQWGLNNMAMLSWQIGKVGTQGKWWSGCEHLTIWSWATWKRGIGNLAEHRVFHKGACKNNLVFTAWIKWTSLFRAGIKISHHLLEMRFPEKVYDFDTLGRILWGRKALIRQILKSETVNHQRFLQQVPESC